MGINTLESLPRLKKLRDEILSSPYHVCTQKSLLTEYFHKYVWVVSGALLTPLHFGLFRRGLERSARGLPQKTWQVALNNWLYALYIKGRGLSREDYYRHYAQAFLHILENMELKVYESELIVGNPSAHRVGAPIHPDLGGLLMLPEVQGINTRMNNPMELEPVQLRELEDKLFLSGSINRCWR
jgi:formate C-acetyltransferase